LPNDSVGEFLNEINNADGSVMLVSRLPFLGRLASLLISGNANSVRIVFQLCTVVYVEQVSPGIWQLLFIAGPLLLTI